MTNQIVTVLHQLIANPTFTGLAVLSGMVAALILFGIALPIIHSRNRRALERSQNRFITLSSHYLLTPISVIQAANARLMEAASLEPAERTKLYEAIGRGERRLWLTAQHLLTVNALTTNTLKLTPTPVSLSDLITEASTAVDLLGRERGVRIHFVDQSQYGNSVNLDRRYTIQALEALLDNATKFSPDGGMVEVSLHGGRAEDFTITIQDVGAGMPAEVVAHIGERFYRAAKLYEFDHEGIGLGLYTAKTLLEIQEVAFEVHSKAGRGTEITLRFPSH